MHDPSPPIILDYHTEPTLRVRSRLDLIFLLLGVPALAAPFVDFSWGVSPAAVVWEAPRMLIEGNRDTSTALFLLLALPFFLPLPAWLLRLRLILWGPPTPVERRVGYGLAALGTLALAILFVAFIFEWKDTAVRERWAFVFTFLILAGGAFTVARAWIGGMDTGSLLLITLLVPYVANSALALQEFRDEPQIGWYDTAFSAAASLAEVTYRCARGFRSRGR